MGSLATDSTGYDRIEVIIARLEAIRINLDNWTRSGVDILN